MANTDIGVPVNWVQLNESQWYRVETSKNYTYYYNRDTKESSWELPNVDAKEQPLEPESGGNIPQNHINDYKMLIKSLNLHNRVQFEQILPRLLTNEAFLRIPQAQRKRLFNTIRKEILEESSKGDADDANLVHDIQIEQLKREEKRQREIEHLVGTTTKHRIKNDGNKDKLDGNGHFKNLYAQEMAETAFMSLLHEKVKQPFCNGRVEPIPEDLIYSDSRSQNEYLKDKQDIYQRFTDEFLTARVELFNTKLQDLSYSHLNSGLKEIIETIGGNLFRHLPEMELNRALKRWKVKVKRELMESFKVMLRQTISYKSGVRKKALEDSKKILRQDKRYQRLEGFPKERDNLILEWLRELEENHENAKSVVLDNEK